MARKNGLTDDDRRKPLSKNASHQEVQEEIAFLRQRCNSLSMRGHYAECIKTIEDNLKFFYTGERWPENFFSILRLHQKCYPSLNKEQSHDEYMAEQLRKNHIPYVMARLLREKDSAIVWTAESFRERALACEAEGNFEDALSYMDLLLKINPGSSSAYLVKGRILGEMGRENEALEAFQQALELNPNNRHARGIVARHHMKRNLPKALEVAQEAIDLQPDDAGNHGLKAEILWKMGRREEAEAALEEAMKRDPYNAAYPYLKGEILYEEGRKAAAIPQYRLAVGLDEKHVPSLTRLTELSYDAQPELALTYAGKVTLLQPQNQSACLTKANLLRKTGKLEAAARQYRALLELNPQSHEAQGGLGELSLIQGEPEQALAYLEEAARLAPGEIRYRLQKGRAHQKLGQREAAVQAYQEAIRLDKQNASAWGELGFLSAETNPKEALEHFAKALSLAPQNPFFHTAKGELLLGIPGRQEEAVECLNLACRYDPGNAELHARLGRLLEDKGNCASAMDHYQKALGLNPDDADSWFRLARLQADTYPGNAYLAICRAIAQSVTRGEYYYGKARIVIALSRDREAMEALYPVLAEAGDAEALQELGEIRGGNALRIALIYINRAIELDPENPAFLGMRANIFFRQGQRPQAQSEYQKLLALNPHQHEALFGMALLLSEKKGEEKKALEYFNHAINAAPAVAEYHAEKAAFLARDETRWQEALEAYTASIAINNQNWQVILAKARLLDGRGRTVDALTEYRRVLLLRPDVAEASARSGILLSDLAPAKALIYLDHAVKLEPGDFRHYAWRGKVQLLLRREEAAEADLQTAVTLGGNTAEVSFALAGILAEQMPEAALDYARRAVGLDGNKAEYHLLLGDLLARRREYAEARACYVKAVELNGKEHRAREELAGIAFLEGAPDAKELVEAALENRRDCPGCLYIKARILAGEGDVGSALAHIQYAVELEPESLPYREFLVELLGKKRAVFKLPMEKRRLEKLRRKLELPLEIPDPPSFSPPEEAKADASVPGEKLSAAEADASGIPQNPNPEE